MRTDIIDCWRRFGIAGDRQCPELVAAGHCRNCARYSELATQTLDRAPPEGHLALAAEVLAAPEEREAGDTLALIVFRLADEWLALPAEVFQEVSAMRPIRPIPHRAGGVLLGLVNVRGALELCVSMPALLGIDRGEAIDKPAALSGARLVVIGGDGDRYAFRADEVVGIQRIAAESLGEVPTTVARLPTAMVKAILPWRQTHAGLLDESRLFEALRRTVQ